MTPALMPLNTNPSPLAYSLHLAVKGSDTLESNSGINGSPAENVRAATPFPFSIFHVSSPHRQ